MPCPSGVERRCDVADLEDAAEIRNVDGERQLMVVGEQSYVLDDCFECCSVLRVVRSGHLEV